jgi:hypothetical protein
MMTDHEKNLNIFYDGGSGGFYLLHQLLITGQFICLFRQKTSDYDDIRNKNFSVDRLENWKKTELWPDNKLLEKIKSKKRKIYFYCGDFPSWIKQEGFKLILWTDIHSQLRLACAKKASFFREDFPISRIKKVIKTSKNNIIKEVYDNLELADANVKLQDIMTVNGLEKFLDSLGLKITEKNVEFLNQYLKLHPPMLLKKIGIEI